MTTRATLPMGNEGLCVVADQGPECVTVRLRGTCDLTTSNVIARFLSGLHASVTGSAVPTVVVNMEEVSFMNSASIKSFVDWVGEVRRLEAKKRYRVVFRTNRQFAWQRRSLEAIRRFAPELVSLEISL